MARVISKQWNTMALVLDTPRMAALSPLWIRLARSSILLGFACSGADPAPLEPLPEPTLGYASYATRLSVPIGNGRSKQCHATVLASRWAVTAAHCFTRVPSGAEGYLRDLGRGFNVEDVIFHPQAHREGLTGLSEPWQNEDIVVAHDLALIPISRPVENVPSLVATPVQGSAVMASTNLVAQFPRRSQQDEAETASARLTELVPASRLLGGEHDGQLIRGEAYGVYPGTSGAGVTLDSPEPTGEKSRSLLVGIIQNAHPDDPNRPFGVVPLYLEPHFEWLELTLRDEPDWEELNP